MEMELNPEYYDSVYVKGGYKGEYHKDADKCIYTDIWKYIISILNKEEKLLDLGCGVGQFANLLIDHGRNYRAGIDFSEVAISKAILLNEGYNFVRANLYENYVYDLFDYDTVLICEVLEHLENDYFVLESIDIGKRIIFTVPNFICKGHVRCFETKESIIERYKGVCDMENANIQVRYISKKNCIFIVDTVKI